MLKNLKFKDAQSRILSVEKVPRVLIQWELEYTTQRLTNLFYNIYRGNSPSEMTLLNPRPIPANTQQEYIDYTTHQKDLLRNYFYRVDAVEIVNGTVVQEVQSEVISPIGAKDLVAMYIIEEHLFAHKYVYGMPVFIYQQRTTGARCECWDPVLKRVTDSHCTICKGTGFISGYYPPISGWMDFNPSPETIQIADWGPKQTQQTDTQFTDYPNLQIGDLVLEIRDMKLWKIENVRSTEKNRVPVLQISRLNGVNRSDIEYTIDVPQDIVEQMLIELREREKTPEF